MSGDGLPRRTRRAAGSFGLLDFPRDPADQYETPPAAVEKLLHHKSFSGGCWDSSAGRGNIVRALRAGLPPGTPIVGTDIARGQDLLAATAMPASCTNIVINPPYRASDAHVRHALKLLADDGKLAVLLRWTWLAAQWRANLYSRLRTTIIVGRLKMLPPGVPDLGHGGSVDFAWFCFGKATGDGGIRIVNAAAADRKR